MAAVVVFAALPTREALEATVGERQGAVTLAAHLLEFVVLGLLVAAAVSLRRSPWETLVLTALVGLAVALGTELLQWALPWRSFEVRDLAVDVVGLALGLALASLRRRAARGA